MEVDQNLRLIGSNCLVKDSKFYAGIVGQWASEPYDQRATDYYVSFFGGSDNVITNHDAYRVGKLTHGGHAYGIKAISNCSFNLFDNNRAYNVGETYYAAYMMHMTMYLRIIISLDKLIGLCL